MSVPILLSLSLPFLVLLTISSTSHAQLSKDDYKNSCPDVESIVRTAVERKHQQTIATASGTLGLFFHDCLVRGCDASVMLFSWNNTAEKDNSDNLSLAGDGFDTVIKANKAVESVPDCGQKVSWADILPLATRDVERTQLGLHSAPLFSRGSTVSKARPELIQHPNLQYTNELKRECLQKVDPMIVIGMDPSSPRKFDNEYFKNLQQGKGLFASDQTLFTYKKAG